MKNFFKTSKVNVNEKYLLVRYRTMMLLIGTLYPLWREVTHLTRTSFGEADETFLDRGLISIIFLVFGLLTYRSVYFKKRVAIYFNIIIYIWFIQVFYLMFLHDFSTDYLLLGTVVIFSSGSSLLNTDEMMYYYLFCLALTGGALAFRLDVENLSFFAGVVTAIAVSYASLRSIMYLFQDLEKSKAQLQKKNEEFVELSSAVQTLFLPAKSHFETESWSVAGFYKPVDGCGGDWWSYSENHRRLSLVLGDVTGHGPGAAMMTASIASYMHAMENESPDLTVPEILEALNAHLIRLQSLRKTGAFLMTLSAVQVDLDRNTLHCWSAGAPFGFLLKNGQDFEIVGSKGTPIGVGHNLELGCTEHTIGTGDRLFMFTDGITEAHINGRQFGEKNLLKLIGSHSESSPREACLALEKMMADLVPGLQEDDYTFVILDFK